MRIVAVGAALDHGLMFIDKRAALFCMALVAGLVDGRHFERARPHTAVRVVAIHAAHLALSQRHVPGALDLCALGLMAVETDLNRGNGRFTVDSMAIRAAKAFERMCASAPMQTLAILMAAEAKLVDLARGRGAEISNKKRTVVIKLSGDLEMVGTGSVAGLAAFGLVLVPGSQREDASMRAIHVGSSLGLVALLALVRRDVFGFGWFRLDHPRQKGQQH